MTESSKVVEMTDGDTRIVEASRELSDHELAGVSGGKASFNDFNFAHPVDKASPVLM
jgi:bacteriocin-like protein